jgi:FtsH-binding integral membrane protein
MLSWVLSVCGVIVFTGLTAYDTQKIKHMGNAGRKGAVLGALTLYLDFINMFLSMLRLFGDRR